MQPSNLYACPLASCAAACCLPAAACLPAAGVERNAIIGDDEEARKRDIPIVQVRVCLCVCDWGRGFKEVDLFDSPSR